MLLKEENQILEKNWISENSIKNDRLYMISCFIKVTHYFKLSEETLFLAVWLFDKICTLEKIGKNNYIVFFIASIHLACKFEESKYYKIESYLDMFSEHIERP